MNIQRYMTRGVIRVVTDSLRATSENKAESIFMKEFAKASRNASKTRYAAEKKGEHIPPFLIASITSECNLHCAGCYSRGNKACYDSEPVDLLSADEWEKIFTEAQDIGISFILLAGGEPLMRYDVITQAAGHKSIMFPVFTNGTFLSDRIIDTFDSNRNLVPIISIEGDRQTTDARRGEGVYDKVVSAMEKIKGRKMVVSDNCEIGIRCRKHLQTGSRSFFRN